MNDQKRLLIDAHLISIFDDEHIVSPRLREALGYALSLPGKRLRPLITLGVAELYGISEEIALPIASATELVHTYSLIHDDLPCMDDDDLRRGKPTLHVAFDEATAILVGDALLTKSFSLVASHEKLEDTRKNNLIISLTKAAGCGGMIGGQMLDIDAEKRTTSLEYVMQMHVQKTGALLGHSFASGALLAGKKDADTLYKMGTEIGVAFQIIDDILDITQSSDVLGKPAHSDVSKAKTTILSYCSIEEAYVLAEEKLTRVLATCRSLFGPKSSIESLIEKLIHRVS